MTTSRERIAGGAAAVLLGLGAGIAHHAGLIGHEAALTAAKNAVDMHAALDDLA